MFSLKQTGVALPGLALATDWQGAMLRTALLCLLVAAAAGPLRVELDLDLERGRPLLSIAHLTGPLRRVFGSTEIRRLALTSFAYAGMQMSLGTFLVTYLNDRLGMTHVLAGVALAFAQAGGVAGHILWGFVADRFVAPMPLLGLLGLTMSGCAVLVGLFTAGWPFVAILAVCTAFGGTAIAWNGVHLAQVARLLPPGRAGEVTGGATFVTFAGVTVVPAAFSAVVSVVGSYTVGYCAVAVLTLASGLRYFAGSR